MGQLVVYREGITKGPVRAFGGLRLPMRSMLANWRPVTVQIDDGSLITLRQGVLKRLPLDSGKHDIYASGVGFAPTHSGVTITHDRDTIVAVTPAWLDGVAPGQPLGELRLRPSVRPEELQPYLFYRLLPYAPGGRTVLPSVAVSVLASAVFLVVFGLIPVASAIYFLITAPPAGLVILAIAAFLAPLAIPAGLGGILTAWRFLRLPRQWRLPEQTVPTST